jgi:hypothetical protein
MDICELFHLGDCDVDELFPTSIFSPIRFETDGCIKTTGLRVRHFYQEHDGWQAYPRPGPAMFLVIASWKTIRTHSAEVWRPSLGSAKELLAQGLTRPLRVPVFIKCFSNSSIFSNKEIPFVSKTVLGSTANASEDRKSKKRKNMLADWI